MNVGDVIRVTCFYETSPLHFNPPMWIVLTDVTKDMPDGDIVVLPQVARDELGFNAEDRSYCLAPEQDTWELVAPDDWPDEVGVAVALHHMGVNPLELDALIEGED